MAAATDELWTIREAAEVAGVTRVAVHGWINLGRLAAATRPGSTKRYIRRSDLLTLLEKRAGEAKGDTP